MAEQMFVLPEEVIESLDIDATQYENIEKRIYQMILEAQSLIQGYTEQTLYFVENDEVYISGEGTAILQLPEKPIVKISKVTVSGKEIVEGEDFEVLESPAFLVAVTGVFPKGVKNVYVKYDHGYEEIPLVVKSVVKSVVSRMLKDSSIVSESFGDYSVKYSPQGGVELTFYEKEALQPYKRMGIS